MYATGMRRTDIITALGVSHQAVTATTARALVQLGARTIPEAVALAVTYGEIHLPGHDARAAQARRHLAAAARLLGAAS